MTFLISILLFFTLLPALLSVLLASRSKPLFIWNMGWFALMSLMASRIFGPWGVMVGVVFASFYIARVLASPRKIQSQIRVRHFQFEPRGFEVRKRTASTTQSEESPATIEAEFTKEL